MKRFLFLVLIILLTGCTEKSSNKELESKSGKSTVNGFKELYFVGIYAGLPSIYRYDYAEDKSRIFWSNKDERVLELLVSEDRKAAYFVTKRRQRLKSSKPAIERGQLYRFDLESKKVELISQLEEGIQIIPFWTDNDRFTLIINSIDKTVASYVNKSTQVYNQFGKLLSDNNETFDLTKDGFPVTNFPPLQYVSPSEKQKVAVIKDTIKIQQFEPKNDFEFYIEDKEIKQIGWNENNKKVIILLLHKNETDVIQKDKISSSLIIFDLDKQKIVKTFEGAGYKRFVLIGDFLIFDNSFGRDSFIEILNLKSLNEERKIKITGGCGLKNIPAL